jgi:NAD-dependent deacetylase
MQAMELNEEIRDRLRTARRVVAFTGAGISKESGLDTFRDLGGIWQQVRPEDMATPQAFRRQPAKVWQWYAARFNRASEVQPNPAHHALASWEKLFPVFTLVTQNVDGLHQRAGNVNVLELHGTLREAKCQHCGRRRDMAEAVAASPDEPPACACGGLFRPSVVWFGEMLPEAAMAAATEQAATCDLFLSVGTSGQVYPAAGLIELAHRQGACLIEINPEPTAHSGMAHLQLAAPAGESLPALTQEIERLRVS